MKILHKRTSAYTEPTIITLERGEIGMTTDNTNPRLYISKNDDTVAEFVDKSYIDKKIAESVRILYTYYVYDNFLSCHLTILIVLKKFRR